MAVPGEPVGRLFVVEKQGPIRILRGKTFEPKPFLDLTGKVVAVEASRTASRACWAWPSTRSS